MNGQYFLKHTEIYNTEKESKTPKPLEGRQEARVFNNLENRGYFLTENHVLDDLPDENQLSLF